MGQKVNPISFRISVLKDWKSKWFTTRFYQKFLASDLDIKDLIFKKYPLGTVADVEIQRRTGEVMITVYTSKPGVIIGRSGQGTLELKDLIQKKEKQKINLNISEILKPEVSASLVAQNIAYQIEKRVAFRRAAKQAIEKAKEAGVRGIKIRLAGRLGGVDIARSETFTYNSIPLQTIRAKIDYAHINAKTTYGIIGVKVWIHQK